MCLLPAQLVRVSDTLQPLTVAALPLHPVCMYPACLSVRHTRRRNRSTVAAVVGTIPLVSRYWFMFLSRGRYPVVKQCFQ